MYPGPIDFISCLLVLLVVTCLKKKSKNSRPHKKNRITEKTKESTHGWRWRDCASRQDR